MEYVFGINVLRNKAKKTPCEQVCDERNQKGITSSRTIQAFSLYSFLKKNTIPKRTNFVLLMF